MAVISSILIFNIRDEFGERTQFRQRDLRGKENIAALVESGHHKKDKFDPRRELIPSEERGKRREWELGERESGDHKERRSHEL